MKPNKSAPEVRKNRTYRLRDGTLALLDDATTRLGLPASQLVEHLLIWALVAEAEGRLVVMRKPVLYALEDIHYVAD